MSLDISIREQKQFIGFAEKYKYTYMLKVAKAKLFFAETIFTGSGLGQFNL